MNKLVILVLALSFVSCQDAVTSGTIVLRENYYWADWVITDIDTDMPKISFNLVLDGYDMTPWFTAAEPVGIYISIAFFSDEMENSVALTAIAPWTDVAADDMASMFCAELWLGYEVINEWREGADTSMIDCVANSFEYGDTNAKYDITITRYLTDLNDAGNDLKAMDGSDQWVNWAIGPYYPDDTVMPLWEHPEEESGVTSFLIRLQSETTETTFSVQTMANLALLAGVALFANFF